MAKKTLILGVVPTGVGGDDSRTGSEKINSNFNEVYAALGAPVSGVIPSALPVNNGGTGAATAAVARTNLGLGTAATRNVGTASGNMMEVGAFGLGSPKETTVNGMLVQKAGFGTSGAQGVTWYVLAKSGMPIMFLVNQGGAASVSIYSIDGGLYKTVSFRTSLNTTVDSNGFIKKASPIVKLFADKIELNDEAGQQDIEFEKLGTGDYLIKNTSGFAQEGWYIEQPKDANGNVLVAVIYEQLENNDISVKTYKKKFDLERTSIVADLEKPADIPDGRWIDIRLQELPQPGPEAEQPSTAGGEHVSE